MGWCIPPSRHSDSGFLLKRLYDLVPPISFLEVADWRLVPRMDSWVDRPVEGRIRKDETNKDTSIYHSKHSNLNVQVRGKGTGPSAFRINQGNGLRLILRQTKKNGEVESGGPRYGSRSVMAMHWNYVFFFLKKEMSCMVTVVRCASTGLSMLSCMSCLTGYYRTFPTKFPMGWHMSIWVTSFSCLLGRHVNEFFREAMNNWRWLPRAHPSSVLVQEYWRRQSCYSLARFSAQDAHIIYFLIVAISGPLSVPQSSTYINLKKQCITPVRRTSKSAKAQPSSESKAYKACGVCPLSLQI